MTARAFIVAALLAIALVAAAPVEAAECHTEPGAPGALAGGYGNTDTVHAEAGGTAVECNSPGEP